MQETFPAPFTPSGGVPQRAPGCNFPRPYQDMALFLFAEQKENNIKWRRRRKKIGVRCKNLDSYTTESLNEPFLRSKKGKMTPQAKKDWVQPVWYGISWCGQQPSSPKKRKKLFLQICKSFFFFSKVRFSLSSTMVYKSLYPFSFRCNPHEFPFPPRQNNNSSYGAVSNPAPQGYPVNRYLHPMGFPWTHLPASSYWGGANKRSGVNKRSGPNKRSG